MFREPCFFILVCISFVLFSSAQLYAQDEEGDIRERERVAPQEKTLPASTYMLRRRRITEKSLISVKVLSYWVSRLILVGIFNDWVGLDMTYRLATFWFMGAIFCLPLLPGKFPVQPIHKCEK